MAKATEVIDAIGKSTSVNDAVRKSYTAQAKTIARGKTNAKDYMVLFPIPNAVVV